MQRQILLISVVLTAVFALTCYVDVAKKGKDHTQDKNELPCGDCSYCMKSQVKWGKDNTTTQWNCGCNNLITDCKKKGHDSKKMKLEGAGDKEWKVDYWCCQGEKCNSVAQNGLTFTLISTFFAHFFR